MTTEPCLVADFSFTFFQHSWEDELNFTPIMHDVSQYISTCSLLANKMLGEAHKHV